MSIDLLAQSTVSDPFSPLAELRESEPVFWSERHRSWILTRYADVLDALKSADLSVELGDDFLQRIPSDHPLRRYIKRWMVFTDPPDHKRLRGLVVRGFTPGVIARMHDDVQVIIDELIDDIRQRATGDFMADFAGPLPAIVIAELFGLPREDRDRIAHLSTAISAVTLREVGTERFDSGAAAMHEFAQYIKWNIDRVRGNPGDDLLSRLVGAHEEGDLLSDDELIGTVMMFLFAGHETTTALLGNGLAALTSHANGLDSLRSFESMESPVEELLRFDGPSRVMVRHAKVDMEVAGTQIQSGQRLLLAIAGANRDPRAFVEPDTLDLNRDPNRHLGFGFGMHFCIGANLARLEARLAFQNLAERLPTLSADVDRLKWRPVMLARSLQSLPYTM